MKLKQQNLPLAALSALLWAATNAQAFQMSSLFNGIIIDEIMSSRHLEATEDTDEQVLTHAHIVDSAIITISAWLVFVVTLEVNDFRHRLMATYNDSTSDEKTSRRYTAALLAIQYGMYDAFIDWGLTYTICYAIVGGITWYNADQNLVYIAEDSCVAWTLPVSCSLYWLVLSLRSSYTHNTFRSSKSQLKTIRDTSGFASNAVRDWTDQDCTISAFRYQVRLGVGKHFTQFVWFLLPFYVALKFWWFLLSIFIGFVGGQLFLYVVFKCRKRSICFMFGVWIVNSAWGISIGTEHIALPIAFLAWLAMCGLFHGLKYCEHRKHSMEEMDDQLFEETAHEKPQDAVAADETAMPSESINSSDRRHVMHKDSTNAAGHGYFYQTAHTRTFYLPRYVAYFDRVQKPNLAAPSGDNNDASELSPRDVYKSIAEAEDAGIKWYNRLWRFLPFVSYWGLLLVGVRDIICCSKKDKDENRQTVSGFQSMSACHKSWFAVAKIIKLAVNAAAIFLAVFAMGASLQATVSKEKAPFVHAQYRTLNIGNVCAYDVKCGNIQTFENKEAADAANYTIAHCGKCSGCSSWQDLSVQWNTRKEAAKLSQGCGLQNMFNRDELYGKYRFATSTSLFVFLLCAHQHHQFIAVTAMITNKLGNFAVGPSLVTPAMCNEAQCEQGNPGEFAKLSGASRRKMNIESDIARPKDQQCHIVRAVPKNDKGFNDWTGFFEPLCPRDLSPP
eukprot:scaffold4385_cov162-Skeletonema_menzelii.AAC.5